MEAVVQNQRSKHIAIKQAKAELRNIARKVLKQEGHPSREQLMRQRELAQLLADNGMATKNIARALKGQKV